MAFTVTKCDVGGSTANGYHYEYLCESADDIANLPTGADSTEISKPAPGSLALLEDGTVYILKNNREWSEFSMAGGGGGSTGGGVFVVHMTSSGESSVLDKTAGEIVEAVLSDKAVVVVDKALWEVDQYVAEFLLGSISNNGDAYEVVFGSDMTFIAATLDDYPTISGD